MTCNAIPLTLEDCSDSYYKPSPRKLLLETQGPSVKKVTTVTGGLAPTTSISAGHSSGDEVMGLMALVRLLKTYSN